MARGMWGETKTFTFEPIEPVPVIGWHRGESSPRWNHATVTIETHRSESRHDRRPTRYAVLGLPVGELNRWTADELRAFAARLTEAANMMDDAADWLGTK